MQRLLLLLVSSLMASPILWAQNTTFHTVTYAEVMPSSSSRATATTALKEYQAASRRQDGYIRFELFEQADRPGRFVIVETWRDQKAFEAREGTVQKQLQDKLQPIRVSDYDRRPYKTLTASAPAPAPANRNTVYVITHVDFANYPPGPMLLQRLAEESRRDEGNVRFDVLQGAMRLNHFTVIEGWQNQKAHDAHVATAHMKQYRDELGPVTGSPLDERVFEAVDIGK
jgi:quinol monooxygenase YgiN